METTDSGAAFSGERRMERRRRVLRGATLRFNGGFGAVEGFVRNESEHGAQLRFGDATGVPPGFELVVNGARRAALVRWRSTRLVGVQFVD
ncbi:MAG: PilZ domain-containing protein [Mesorhizobium sp.]|uniref:PilZ domain-containing protein n=1 Tax=Mesorhizobium sp. TaxID=1871066 RepID=UPI0012126528|nr:PilZ domain-containing protein [Mesorhizobium sp.]TIQ37628.1 MAG: PilZ domain-containing protein [Mesorhizobium sp.]